MRPAESDPRIHLGRVGFYGHSKGGPERKRWDLNATRLRHSAPKTLRN